VAAHRLRQCTRKTDTVARLGGDEFAVVLPGTGHTSAAGTAQRIIEAMAEPMAVGGDSAAVGASAGVAVSSSGQSPDQLLKDADQALYTAKRGGRGRYMVFTGREGQDD
jgi:diguanylate cyclase